MAARSLRAGHGASVPVMILIDQSAPHGVVQLLDAGADDVMTKPVNAAELMARARALVRRSHGIAHPVITVGPIELRQHERLALRQRPAAEPDPQRVRDGGDPLRSGASRSSPRMRFSIICMAASTSQSRRSSTCSSARYDTSWVRRHRISKRCGAAAIG
jgi:DNA-binding NarL/FixJ family response regulator